MAGYVQSEEIRRTTCLLERVLPELTCLFELFLGHFASAAGYLGFGRWGDGCGRIELICHIEGKVKLTPSGPCGVGFLSNSGSQGFSEFFFLKSPVVEGGKLELLLVCEAAPVVVTCTSLTQRGVKTRARL